MRSLLLFALPAIFATACLDTDGTAGDHRDGSHECVVGGCSGQLCTDGEDTGSTCEWHDEYACYADATCSRQANGSCGWVETVELNECLHSPPSP